MDTFPYKPFDHPSLSSGVPSGPSAAPCPGGKRSQRKKGAGVKLSTDPQSVAARERRHRISHRFKILQSLVPGGSKMDTVSMLEEAIHYVKFLQSQIRLHHSIMASSSQGDPAAAAATDAPPCSDLVFPYDYETHVSSIGNSTTAPTVLSPQQPFSYHLPPVAPLPNRPGYSFQGEEEDGFFPCVSFLHDN